jgi:hypothetical protein
VIGATAPGRGRDVSIDPGSDRGHVPSPLPVSPVITTTYRPIVKGSSLAAGAFI